MIDAACARCGKAYSHGAIFQYEGHTMTILPSTARLTDLFPEGPVLSDRPQPVGRRAVGEVELFEVDRREKVGVHHNGRAVGPVAYQRR